MCDFAHPTSRVGCITADTAVDRLLTDRVTARKIIDAVAEHFATQEVAAAAFEEPDGCWSVAIHFRNRSLEPPLRALIAAAAGAAAGRSRGAGCTCACPRLDAEGPASAARRLQDHQRRDPERAVPDQTSQEQRGRRKEAVKRKEEGGRRKEVVR